MAYMSQERKAEIAQRLKPIMPKGWKYSLSVNHHSTIVLTIQSAPVDLLAEYNRVAKERYDGSAISVHHPYEPRQGYTDINPYHPDGCFDGGLLALFRRILSAMNNGNHDRSDLQTDYFDVGWYVSIKIGRWDSPFKWAPNHAFRKDSEPSYGTLKAQVEALKAQLGEN